MKVIRATVILSFFVTFFGSVDSAAACTCMDPMPLQAEVEASSVVFAGEVIARRDVVTDDGFPSAYGFTFRVSRAWKGVTTDTVEVGTPSLGPSCGFHFLVGAEYLVYAGGGGIASATSFGGGGVKQP
jgi:hypothetical protein